MAKTKLRTLLEQLPTNDSFQDDAWTVNKDLSDEQIHVYNHGYEEGLRDGVHSGEHTATKDIIAFILTLDDKQLITFRNLMRREQSNVK